jgi:hypothetical protein
MRLCASILLLAIVVAGCAEKKPPEQRSTVSLAPGGPQLVEIGSEPAQPIDPNKPLDAKPELPVFVRLEVWHLLVPYGTISRNEAFWKRINEQCVDVATYDLLYKNGIRVGEAPQAEWNFFRQIIEEHPAISQRSLFAGPEGNGIELQMRDSMPWQELFFYDGSNLLSGRTYDHSENLMTMRFHPTPRKLGWVRVALCPVVRATRKRLEFTTRNDEREVVYTAPERLYECNLRADIPLGSFLIIAPSEAARRRTSIGHAFLTRDGEAERYEQVLIIAPRPFTLERADVAAGAEKK